MKVFKAGSSTDRPFKGIQPILEGQVFSIKFKLLMIQGEILKHGT